MFAYLKGTLTDLRPDTATLEVNGIGYSISIHRRLSERLPQIGTSVCLHTTFVVREFSHTLYGFSEVEERKVFETLIDITGVGPKLALSLLGHLTFAELNAAVSGKDIPLLCKVPGVGKKTAERLLVELKGKLGDPLKNGYAPGIFEISEKSHSKHPEDAMSALINLGYHRNAAQKAVQQSISNLPESADLASVITAALRYL